MSRNYEKLVKGATKLKLAPPKAKYVEPLLSGLRHTDDLRSIMSSISRRLDDSAYSVVFKSHILLHIMIREGPPNSVLKYLKRHPNMLDCQGIRRQRGGGLDGGSEASVEGLLRYNNYLQVRALRFDEQKGDYVRPKYLHRDDDLKFLSVEKGLLKECQSILDQLLALLKCRYYEEELNEDTLLTAFRLLVEDVLVLYETLNQGVINVLEHYFEMSRYDAEKALKIYQKFVKITTQVVSYLKTAKQMEYATKIHVPNIKHAPTSLADSLEDYLNDPDFDLIRRQYLAEKELRETEKRNGHRKSSDATVRNVDRTASQRRSVSMPDAAAAQQIQQQALQQQQQQMQQQPLVDLFGPSGIQMQETSIQMDPVQQQQQQAMLQQQQAQQQQAMMQQQQQQQQEQMMQQQQAQLQAQQQAQLQAQQQQQALQQQQAQQQAQQQQQQAQQQQQFGHNPWGPPQQPQQQQPLFQQQQQPMQQQNTIIPVQQQQMQQQPMQQQTTGSNPFRKSMLQQQMQPMQQQMPQQQQQLPQQHSGNPFGSLSRAPSTSSTLYSISEPTTTPTSPAMTAPNASVAASPASVASSSASMPAGQLIQQTTGTNPFSGGMAVQQAPMQQQQNGFQQQQPLQQQTTGYNPFRKSMAQQQMQTPMYNPTFGGLEQLQTNPVFPQTQHQQQQGQFF